MRWQGTRLTRSHVMTPLLTSGHQDQLHPFQLIIITHHQHHHQPSNITASFKQHPNGQFKGVLRLQGHPRRPAQDNKHHARRYPSPRPRNADSYPLSTGSGRTGASEEKGCNKSSSSSNGRAPHDYKALPLCRPRTRHCPARVYDILLYRGWRDSTCFGLLACSLAPSPYRRYPVLWCVCAALGRWGLLGPSLFFARTPSSSCSRLFDLRVKAALLARSLGGWDYLARGETHSGRGLRLSTF